MPLKRSYSNLPMNLRRTVECLFCQALRPKAIYYSTLSAAALLLKLFQHEGKGELLMLKGKNSYPPAFLPLKGKNSYPGRVSFEG